MVFPLLQGIDFDEIEQRVRCLAQIINSACKDSIEAILGECGEKVDEVIDSGDEEDPKKDISLLKKVSNFINVEFVVRALPCLLYPTPYLSRFISYLTAILVSLISGEKCSGQGPECDRLGRNV